MKSPAGEAREAETQEKAGRTSPEAAGSSGRPHRKSAARLAPGRSAPPRRPGLSHLTDKALRAIAVTHPATADELLVIPGIGMSTVEKYGASIYRIVREKG